MYGVITVFQIWFRYRFMLFFSNMLIFNLYSLRHFFVMHEIAVDGCLIGSAFEFCSSIYPPLLSFVLSEGFSTKPSIMVEHIFVEKKSFLASIDPWRKYEENNENLQNLITLNQDISQINSNWLMNKMSTLWEPGFGIKRNFKTPMMQIQILKFAWLHIYRTPPIKFEDIIWILCKM